MKKFIIWLASLVLCTSASAANLSSFSSIVGLRDTVSSFTFVDGDVNTTNDTIAETDSPVYPGYQITFTTSGTLPSPLSTGTTYYVVQRTGTTFKVSTTPGFAGTPVDITSAAGGGTHTVNITGGSVKTQQTNMDELLVMNSGRLTESRGRVGVYKNTFNTTLSTNTIIHTVTAGKTFWLTAYTTSYLASGAGAPTLHIQDGTNTARRIITTCAGSVTFSCNQFMNLGDNPMPFTTDVRITVSNSPNGGVTIIGYEE